MFCKNPDHKNIRKIKVDGSEIDSCVLGPKWNAHVENIMSNASKRMYLLYQLKGFAK